MWFALALQAAAVASAPTLGSAPVRQGVANDPAVRARTEDVLRLLDNKGGYDTTFAPAFRNAVPKAQFDAIARQLSDALGRPTGVESITAVTPWSARVRIGYERGVLNADIVVDSTAPHLVTGLLAKGAEPRGPQVASVDEVVRQIAALPGRTGFALAKLGDGARPLTAGREAGRPLAIGSAFKLVILAELARSIAAGERKWDDVVTLDGSALPGGGYAQQPKGTKIPLRELAGRMISVSDNSATDILLFHLGRTKVEAMLPVVGMTDGGRRNVPFLGALELFKLKGVNGGALGVEYLTLDAVGRRRMLDGKVAATPITAIPRDLFQDKKPVRIAELEWFASPNDLIRTMDWLRRHSEGPAGAELRAILSKNPGLPSATESWSYVGYKGGSEPGVLTMTFLLRGKNGAWAALSAGWNDSASDVDLLKFSGLVGSALRLAAPN